MRSSFIVRVLLAAALVFMFACAQQDSNFLYDTGDTGEGVEASAKWSTGLPDCGGFWGTGGHYFTGWAHTDLTTGDYSHYWSPNCYMSERDNACGGDGDNLVSFWLGPDYTTWPNDYKLTSTGNKAKAYLSAKEAEYWATGMTK